MIYIVIALVIVIASTIVLTQKSIIRVIAEKRALPIIEDILFPQGEQNKAQIIQDIHQLTNNRLSDELVMDYFYKIKGLQVLNINRPMNFWVKMYLTTPTKVKLNYFEQVKFYETFLNYPKIHSDIGSDNRVNPGNQIEKKIKAQLVGKLIPQKFA
ncbi:hypothetical protein [Saccharicrinis sp. 156]|uniref:hypothetical protein n=1 Tax=Saccharicrinis sp. 156 TaxID=3417574 RepID=UPI003D33D100